MRTLQRVLTLAAKIDGGHTVDLLELLPGERLRPRFRRDALLAWLNDQPANGGR